MAATLAVLLRSWLPVAQAGNRAAGDFTVGTANIAGVVTSANEPKGGRVIAETTELPTKYHQAGTTRMGNDPEDSVVDRIC